MSNRKLTEIKRLAPSVLLAGLLPVMGQEANFYAGTSVESAKKLVASAKDFGLSLKDYLDIACDPRQETDDKQRARFQLQPGQFLTGVDAAMLQLGLPARDDFNQGILLQAASDTFQTYPGTRAMFPEVIDSMLRWKNRQSQLEQLAPLISQTRTINGTELISTAVLDDSQQRGTFIVAEFGEIPVRTIRTSEQSVRFYKHGSGIRTSYEFERRASLDILTPYAARVARELEISKVRAATAVLLNGDGVNAAAPVESVTSYGGVVYDAATPATRVRAQYAAVMQWVISKAAAGTPIDTIVGNLGMYLELLMMFTPTLPSNYSLADAMKDHGGPSFNLALPGLNGSVINFALSTSMPNNKILGFSKAETLEELVEAGSSIAENDRAITNQSITYVRTENSGFRLPFNDTRYVLDFTA